LFVPEDYPYVFKIPSDESMIDFDKVIEFYVKTQKMNPVADMRQYAVKNFTWKKVFEQALQRVGMF